ncbi:MAG: MarR family transcriptional regulator [Gammaproteobacteria bacterium]|nr:MarR family transcriptional regulator [Gammaproteobacteria bacterium]
MTDIKHNANLLFLREDQLYESMELLFFAYRDFTTECDKILSAYDFGRAHHRAIYFIARNPNISVTELLEILRITKQSLSRVLSQLVDNEYVITEQCKVDRRRRLLKITHKGSELEDKLSKIHKEILSRAFRGAGAEAVAGYRNVLLGIIDEKDHKRFKKR